ncbi:MAG: right-handed parallel beta-helix repeat-containing protein [Pseudomonadota bacterium]
MALSAVVLVSLFPSAFESAYAAGSAARLCSAEEMRSLKAPATAAEPAFTMVCSPTLGPGDTISKQILFRGQAASSALLDCAGGRLVGNSIKADTIEVNSIETAPGEWSRPTDVTIRNCQVDGSVRVWGMSVNGEGERVRQSSIRLGHIERAQSAAPRGVTIENSTITARGRIPIYLAPGVTYFTFSNSVLAGHSQSVAIYFDAESGHNVIRNSRLAVKSRREQIAIDGSAHNQIVGNRFERLARGGVYLYRNCGLQGTVRHQTPSYNRVTGNTFIKPRWWENRVSRDNLAMNWSLGSPVIWENSRRRKNWFCDDDKGYPFGSSIDDASGATGNILQH